MPNQSGSRIYTRLIVPENLKPLTSGIYKTRIVVTMEQGKALQKKKVYTVTIRDCINLI